MAASRRLQGEIDRCLKKVAEGVEQFEDIWKKVHNANNTNQKEKYEADLKKEIKKLQRLRDQIKSWLTSAEIKDKTQLLENRKLIETQMERFKVVERETKTKAYSKEGLGAAQNKDPAQREKEELNRWLNESIDSLTMQVDQFECEIEALLAGGKKKKMDKDKSDRIEELKEWLERHRFNIKKLEILMRMLNNESIDCENLKKIKDDVDYYVESNQEPDFMENEGLYDDIEMEDLDYPATDLPGVLGAVGDSTEASTPSPSVCGSSPAPSPASSHTTASSVSSNNTNNNVTMTAAAVVAAAAAASSSQVVSSNSTPGSGSNSTSSSSSNSSTNNGTSAAVATAAAANATASSTAAAASASTPSAVSATTTATTITSSQLQSSTPTAASVVLNNHSNSSSSNSNAGGGSSSDQHHHNNADSAVAATTNNISSTNNASSGGPATPNTNHNTNNSTHHTVERSNKRNNKEDSRTPVKPTVVRPNAANSNAIITKGSHTPSKPVQGSTSVSTPNNSSTSSGMSYLAASQHNAKNATAKSKEDHNSHINQNSTPAINHVASQQQQQQQQQQAAAAAVAAAAAAAQQQLAAQQQQQQQQQQAQQQQNISSATPNGPLLHGSHHPHLHNKVLNSTDSATASLKNIAQKKLNEVSHHTSQAAMAAAAAAAAVASSGAGGAALAGGAVVASSGGPAASTASAAAVSSSSLQPAVSSTTAVSSVTGVAPTSAAPSAPMGEAHIPQLLGVAPLGLTPLTADNELQFKRLQAAYYHMPHPADSERLRIHFPRQPVTTPPHFPQVPPPLSDTVDFFQRLSTETLFFIFYYLEGTKAQYLAAKALKKQSWRFHTKYMMWFQRHEEPKAITDEYEQGTYIFFDYDNWGQRKKENFTFEYRFLEDRDLN